MRKSVILFIVLVAALIVASLTDKKEISINGRDYVVADKVILQ
ncbi:MAG: hypothetical protein V3U92_15325 [Cellulophaga sp.]